MKDFIWKKFSLKIYLWKKLSFENQLKEFIYSLWMKVKKLRKNISFTEEQYKTNLPK